jgi:N-acetylmuramoyl-L-alanine amidase
MRQIALILSIFLAVSLVGYTEDREISTLLTELDAYMEWNPLREIGVILIDSNKIAFKTGVPFVLINYSEKINVDAPVRRDGGIYFTDSAVAAMKDALIRMRFRSQGSAFRVSTILIDPGHGGEDPGTVRKSDDGKKILLMEKDVVLSVARSLSGLLQSAFPDKKIILTRSSDTYVSLESRAEMANELLSRTAESILFLSIHANSTATRKDAAGFEVWCLPPEYKRTLLDADGVESQDLDLVSILNSMREDEISVESIVLAREILSGMEGKVGSVTENRGLREEDWYVVRNAKMPAVLIEVGFLSNKEEAVRLADPQYQKDLAEGIYNGIKSFISRFEDSGSSGAR